MTLPVPRFCIVILLLLSQIGCFVVFGFVVVTVAPPLVAVVQQAGRTSCSRSRSRSSNNIGGGEHHVVVLNLGLGEYSINLEKPLGMILEERGNNGSSTVTGIIGTGVQVQEVIKDAAAAGSAWKSGLVAPGELLLQIDGVDVSQSDFDSVMDILTSTTTTTTTTSSSTSTSNTVNLIFGDGLGQLDMPKNVLQRLETTEDAFFVDAVVRQAVREIRRDGRLGDLLNVEVVIGAGINNNSGNSDNNNTIRGMVRFFAIFSTDGVTTYSCNVSATGIRKIDNNNNNNNDKNDDIKIVSLSCAKDEGLGRTFDLIREEA